MAESYLHNKDTENAIRGTTESTDDIRLIIDVTYLVIDATSGGNIKIGVNTLDSVLDRVEKYGINADSLYKALLEQGVDPEEIKKAPYNNDKMTFLRDWLLPKAIAEHKHRYTHKGADYVYKSQDDDDDNWSGEDKNRSWLVKRKLLQDTIKNVYPVSSSYAENIAMTLYSIHRLRDLQYNEGGGIPQEYYFSIGKELKKYTLPLIKNETLLIK